MQTLIRPLAIAVCLVAVATAQVAVRIGKNHEQVKQAFRPVIARANQSTVRVLSGPRGKDVALGTIVHSDGYIVTLAAELPQHPVCQLPDGRRVAAVRVKTIADPALVVLRIAARDLPSVPWRLGPEPPLGSLLATPGRGPDPVAIGIVSSVSPAATDRPGTGRLQHDTILRQVDCGGPVVDLEGRAVGINLRRADRTTTIALSAAAVRRILQDLQLDPPDGHPAGQQGRGATPRQSAGSAAPPSRLQSLEARVRTVATQGVACTVAVQIGTTRGSGVIASPEGFVLTAAHVCPRANAKATIWLADGRKVTGTCRGADRTADAGLIQLDGTGPWPHADPTHWPVARPGQWCVATGHPRGRWPGGPPVVRLGRVLDRNVDGIRTDNTLAPGDSGGPLFDLDGHLIAVHSHIGRHLARNVHVPVENFRTRWQRLTQGDVWGEPVRAQPPHGPGQE